ncbi:MAG: cohesin domain-containing protein [Candidatus Poribacteria bacterium]|nr:cohesin domain-containing protein [Candidatus Poribacteria bacterium]
MKNWKIFITFISALILILGNSHSVNAQENLAQQAYAIFEQSCLNCHGEHGAFTEEIIIDHTALIETGTVVPGKPLESELYRRLLVDDLAKRMPLGQPKLPDAAIRTIGNWIQAGAPDWESTAATDGSFITPKKMLDTIEKHVNSLSPFDRAFARYFTLTHLYNAGETTEALHAYQRALSKLVNSLSWGREVIIPKPIDAQETIFYIDLRDYEWEVGTDRWSLIEAEYPYEIEFNAQTQTALREKLTNLREKMDCEVPFIHVDWFLATASLPPLYHNILDLPETDRELEERLEVNVVENLRNAAGKRVWRAGFNDSGVSNHNRVVERHISRYGAYWKSYDFAGSVETQNIFTHPLAFTHDGGEIIFNLPNGLQAYLLADAGGRRLDAAPIDIVRNPAASDPTVRNGLSCIGCHTEGMKDFEDQVRGVVQKNPNPPFNKDRALQLYTDKATMAGLVAEDTARYKQALKATGDVFGGIEPVQRFHEAFQRPLDAAQAAAAVGLETEMFLRKIRENTGLQNLGLLVLENDTMKRDTWTNQFDEVVFALDFPAKSAVTPVDSQTERIPGESVHFPDPNLRAAVAETLGKAPGSTITVAEMATLKRLHVNGMDIRDLRGLGFATNLESLEVKNNLISDLSPISELTQLDRLLLGDNKISDISPLAGLIQLGQLGFAGNKISDISPLRELKSLGSLAIYDNEISDISSLSGLTNLRGLSIYKNPILDLSPLANLKNLNWIRMRVEPPGDLSPLAELINLESVAYWGSGEPVPDLSPLTKLPKLAKIDIEGGGKVDVSPLSGLITIKELWLPDCGISNLSFLEKLTTLERANLGHNNISDVSPLSALPNLKWLDLRENQISDFSPLGGVREQITLIWYNNPGFPKGGPKIEGPWLWAILPDVNIADRRALLDRDLLSEVTGGKMTEAEIAVRGATEGRSVGNSVWTSHKFPSTGRIADMLKPSAPEGAIYGSVLLFSPREQATTLYVGSYLDLQVWFNGTLIHQHPRYHRRGTDYTDAYPVTLQQGKNVLLVALHSHGHGFFGFEPGTEYTVSNSGIGYASSKPTIHVGDTFTLDIRAENLPDLAGWQFDIAFDAAALKAIEVNEGEFLKTGGATTFFQRGTINNTAGRIRGLSSASLSGEGVPGTGVLLSVTFSAKADGQTQLVLHNLQFGSSTGEAIPAEPRKTVIVVEERLTIGDINRDGQVSILDMILIAKHLGETAPTNSEVDINGDGVVSILDLILVAQQMDKSTAAAPAAIAAMNSGELNPAMIQTWITQAQVEDDGSVAFREGITFLQSLLAVLLPEETALLPNYPNPFNPETWIPYHLTNSSNVQITIYDTRGTIVRQLDLGHQPQGYYTSQSRAAYWDGRNTVGERVASGIYFYTLTAGDFTATRKLLIRK